MITGILGGTFNPMHIGHLILAQDAFERFELDQVLFMPCGVPPHKQRLPIAQSGHRLAMVSAAIEGDPRMEVSTLELDRQGPSYSIDTVRALQQEAPDTRFRFIIGADTLTELHTWHAIYELLELCEFVSLGRPGWEQGPAIQSRIQLDAPWPERLAANLAGGHLVNISSTEIRTRLAEGLSIRYLVPPEVEMYICEHNLYRA